MMPGIDGFAVCKRLKIDLKTRDIPIIFLTAKTESDSILKGFEAGAVDYVIIPLNLAQKIFEMGFSTQKNKVSGFGLSMSRRLLRQNFGDIELESPGNENSGATFLVWINKGQ